MTFEPVQAGAPHFPVRLKPLVEFDQRFKAKAVEALLAVGADGNQTGIAQHAKLLRNRRLCHGEPSDQGVHGLLSVEQLVEDLPAAPLRDDFEGFSGDHPSSMLQQVYVCQVMYRASERRHRAAYLRSPHGATVLPPHASRPAPDRGAADHAWDVHPLSR